MDLEFLDNYGIAHLISKEELDNIIEHMIENYDKSGKFYDSNASQSFLAENIKNHNSVFAILNKKAIEIFEKQKQEKENRRREREKKWQDPNIDLIALYTEEYDDNALEFEEEYEWEIVGCIYGSILKSFESIAIILRSSNNDLLSETLIIKLLNLLCLFNVIFRHNDRLLK